MAATFKFSETLYLPISLRGHLSAPHNIQDGSFLELMGSHGAASELDFNR